MGPILVTGSNGFVGKALCAELAERGIAVRKTARQATEAGVFAVGDIGASTDWQAALQGVGVVIHLASRVHIMNDTIEASEALYHEVNVAGTERLANCAAAAGVRRLIFLSSIKVNGEASIAPFTALDQPLPQDAYATSKWHAEQALHKISARTGMEVVILRPPLIYGPGVKANFLQMLRWIEKGVPLPLSSVHNQRSLLFLGNLVDGLITSIRHPDAAGKIYLLSDGEDVSTPALIAKIAFLMGKPDRLMACPVWMLSAMAKIIGKKEAVDRLMASLQIDSSVIRQDLGWSPPFTLDQGLRDTVAWYQRTFV